ncbi:MAG: maleylpyruvate isomerase family mycothiol-dependent enzyme [Acidimicrobiales bacterium]|jgi:uncharacterized protein (TIGR03083 family)
MPTHVDKAGSVDLLRHQFRSLVAVCSSLSDEQWNVATCLPGWSVKDVLSHIIGTESMLAGVPAPSVDISHLDHMRNGVAESNEIWVESMRSLSGDELLDRFGQITGRRLAALEAMTQADFDAPSWTPVGNDETYGRFMRIRHYDCFMHEHDIRDALGLPPRLEARDIASALDEVSTGLGYIVGRRASMPEGSRVRIDLSGPGSRTFLVQVEGRAAQVESFDQPPTVGVELPVMMFLRLTGGRVDIQRGGGGEIGFTGDRRLGEQLVANLAFTI